MGTTRAAFETPAGRWVQMDVRDGTSDWNTVNAITKVGDEYHLPRDQEGCAVDVGSHIGAWAIALLVDNPAMRCVAIEALPENVLLIESNAALNGVSDRLVIRHGAASDSQIPVSIGYTEGDPVHEFIGGANRGGRNVVVPGITLDDALDEVLNFAGATRVALLKIDCEGCEYPFLQGPGLARVERIVGEVHFGSAQLGRQLEATHFVTFPGFDANPDFGPFTAVNHDMVVAIPTALIPALMDMIGGEDPS